MHPDQELRLKLLKEYVRKHGWAKLRSLDRKKYKGVALARWVYDRQTDYRRGKLSKELIKALESIIGFQWNGYRRDPGYRLAALKNYAKTHSLTDLRQRDSHRGVKLGVFVNYLRHKYQSGELDRKTIRELERLHGWSWHPIKDQHLRTLKVLKQFIAKYGLAELRTTTKYRGVNIGTWVASRKQNYHEGILPDYLLTELRSIKGWRWS